MIRVKKLIKGRVTLILFGVALVFLHLYLGLTWIWRSPAVLPSPHQNDFTSLNFALVLGNEAGSDRLLWSDPSFVRISKNPKIEILAGTISNRGNDVYWTKTPISYVVTSIPSIILGPSHMSIRGGGLVLLFALMVSVYTTVRTIKGPEISLAAAAFTSFIPAIAGGIGYAFPILGTATGAAIALALVLQTDLMRKPIISVLAGTVCALSLRWGESVGDGLRAISVVLPPALIIMLGGFLSPNRRKLALLGSVLFIASFCIVSDISWVKAGYSYISQEGNLDKNTFSRFLNWTTWAGILDKDLAGRPIMIFFTIGLVGLLFNKQRWHSAALAIALISPITILTLSTKVLQYYAIVAVVPLGIISIVGISSFPKIGTKLAFVAPFLVLPSLIFCSFNDYFPNKRCESWAQTWLSSSTGPTCNIPKSLPIFPWPAGPTDTIRPWLSKWLKTEAVNTINSLPENSTILVLITEGSVASDSVAHTIQLMRPDIDVQMIPDDSPKPPPILKNRLDKLVMVVTTSNFEGNYSNRIPLYLGNFETSLEGPGIKLFSKSKQQGR